MTVVQMSLGNLSGISLVNCNVHPKWQYCNYKMLTSKEENMHNEGESTYNVKINNEKGVRVSHRTLKLVQQQQT